MLRAISRLQQVLVQPLVLMVQLQQVLTLMLQQMLQLQQVLAQKQVAQAVSQSAQMQMLQ